MPISKEEIRKLLGPSPVKGYDELQDLEQIAKQITANEKERHELIEKRDQLIHKAIVECDVTQSAIADVCYLSRTRVSQIIHDMIYKEFTTSPPVDEAQAALDAYQAAVAKELGPKT
jgi:DNA-directed RNA polymerase specialized sigma subunit